MKYGYEGPEPKRRAGGFVFKAGIYREIGDGLLNDAILDQFADAGIGTCGAVETPAVAEVENAPSFQATNGVGEMVDESGSDVPSVDELEALTKPELIEYARSEGLPANAAMNKAELIARIRGEG